MINTPSPDKEYLKWFSALAAIPHESKHERQLSDFLAAFAEERRLPVVQDEAGNIFIRKPGTHGLENAPAVVLQGHMDMVCTVRPGSGFDPRRDPPRVVVRWVRTTAWRWPTLSPCWIPGIFLTPRSRW